MRRLFAHLLTACAVLVALAHPLPSAAQAEGQPLLNLPRVALRAGTFGIQAQVATGFNVYTGLMYRREMPQHEGMLFVYDAPAVHCFYMRNTLLPLSIAFIADDGTIVNIRDMQPLTLDSHCAERPVRYALEMHQGWFAKRGIKPGFKLSGAPWGTP
ncbi:MAG TPA: DUF192 domain-containing protein [Burkholderiaceae bacterium]|nr:DUF192 domain-containing protein [Burkholderiaceae bacterium]